MATALGITNMSLGIEGGGYGVAVQATAYGEIISCDIKLDKDMKPVEDTAGTRKGSRLIVEGAQKVGGTIKSYVYPGFVGYWLKNAFGAINSGAKGTETTVYQHTFTQASSLPFFYTLQLDRGNSEVVRWVSCFVKSFKMSGKDGLIDLDVAIDAYDEVNGGSYTPTQATEAPLVFHQARIGFGSSIANARTAASSLATSTALLGWDFEYDNQTQPSHMSGNKRPNRIDPKLAKAKFTFSKFFEDTTQRAAYWGVTKQAAVIRIIGPAIGAISFYQLDIELPAIYYTAQSVDYGAGNLLEEKCEVVGLYDDSATEMCRAILVNLKQNYTS